MQFLATNERPRRSPSQDGSDGFTLIEMLIAMVVLSVGLVSVVAITAYVSRMNADSNTISVLVTSAESQLDQLRSVNWDSSTCDPSLTVGGSLTTNVDNHYATITGTPAGTLIVRWVVAQGGTSEYRYATVNASCASGVGDVKNGVTLTTIIARN